MAVAPVLDHVGGDRGIGDGVEVVIGKVLAALPALQPHIAADPGGKPLPGVLLDGDRLAFCLEGRRRLVPGPGEVHLAACHRLAEIGVVGPVEPHVLVHLAQEIGGLLELRVRQRRPVLDADGKARQRIGVVDIVADRHAVLELRIGEGLQRGDLLGLDRIRAVGQHRVAPLEGNEPGGAVRRGHQVLHLLEVRQDVVPVGELGRVERLQKTRLAPLHDTLRTGMGDIRLEAGAQLLEGLLLVAEEGEVRRAAVLFRIGGVEGGVLVARPVEHRQRIGGEGGKRGSEGKGGGENRRDGMSGRVCVLHAILLPRFGFPIVIVVPAM